MQQQQHSRQVSSQLLLQQGHMPGAQCGLCARHGLEQQQQQLQLALLVQQHPSQHLQEQQRSQQQQPGQATGCGS